MNSTIKLSGLLVIAFQFLTIGITSGQNYKAINTDATSYFYDSISLDIIPIRIDSVSTFGNENQYFGMRQIRQTDYPCFTPFGASWIGDVVNENQEGVFQFIQYSFSPSDSADVFTIRSRALPGDAWHFYNYHTNNQYIEAVVSQISFASFIGLADSVKIITLQHKDASGQNVSDPINGQKLLLSQNYGLIRLPKFDEFNINLKFLDMCGKSNPVTGRTNLTFEDIFDFQPGDEFHIAYDDSPYVFWYPKESGFLIQHVLERFNSSNSDTVTYRIAQCKTSTYTPGMGQYTITNSVDTVIVKYIKFNFPAFVSDPKEPQILAGMGLELTESNMGLSSTNVLQQSGTSWKLTNATWPLWSDETQQCWSYAIIDDFENSAYYYKGLGGPYHYHLGIITTNYRILVYYKKGSESWGTPLDCETLLHVGMPESPSNQDLKIYPNPTSGLITISANLQLPYSFEIFDPSGKKAATFKLYQQVQSFDLSKFPAGLYTYKLSSANGDAFRGKIIIQ